MNKTNHQAGHEAEQRVAQWLKSQKFKILDINWKTRRCEIDIIASRKRVLYFVDVKSRKSATWGSGLDYVTAKKHAQMHFAAEVWLSENEWGHDVRLAVVAVDGDHIKFVELVD